jgi:hypothetical protein
VLFDRLYRFARGGAEHRRIAPVALGGHHGGEQDRRRSGSWLPPCEAIRALALDAVVKVPAEHAGWGRGRIVTAQQQLESFSAQ